MRGARGPTQSSGDLHRRACRTSQIPGVVAAFDLAIAPYAASADTYFSPLKLFEYAAMAKAIVATTGGQAEQLFPPDSLALYAAGDVAALAARIETLAADPLLREPVWAAPPPRSSAPTTVGTAPPRGSSP